MRLWESAAAASGSLDLLKWVWSLDIADGNRKIVLRVAVDNVHLEIVHWIMDQSYADVESV
ncbi:hypothetical protein PC116_g14590 [Phytophthora cactorum]|nr:hypothetical protein Pcac1_g28038 [Phytophthora cactorum]KAG2908631.1 hypothetical protein PC114_g10379 [Phytophthora cactorum]KAG2941440.1 hypothetical protein PC117_g10218 [Phytophthora cactorum]KAG3016472.1 hypothetical protein PC119_g11349 [Phytophthora cactorum]KAG4053853.1 hypothetical protein PC123_g11019 [Phytophthora cactorum]